jgi:hypothetical protein
MMRAGSIFGLTRSSKNPASTRLAAAAESRMWRAGGARVPHGPPEMAEGFIVE